MNKALFWICAVILLGVGACGGLWPLQAAPQSAAPVNPLVPPPTLIPNLITVNTPTVVVATVSIPDPTLNPSSVQLLRVNANGSTSVVADMRDDGKGGDQKPGDKVFTATFTLNESQIGVFGFQAAADFRGKNQVLSNVQQLPVLAPHINPVILPPDPGDAGMVTLAGIDSDHDGVRDDVQRYIIFSYPYSEMLRLSLFNIANALQTSLIANTPLSVSTIECFQYVVNLKGTADPTSVYINLRSQQLNTNQRFAAYFNHPPRSLKYALPTDLSHSCSFDTVGLPN